MVFLLLGSSPGGLELQVPPLAELLADLSPRVYLIHGSKGGDSCVFSGTSIKVDCGTPKSPWSAVRLFSYARRNRLRLFHGFNIGPVYLLVLRLAGVRKIVYSIRGSIYWKKKWKKPLIKVIWKLALTPRIVFVSNSDYSAARFRQLVWPRAKIKTLYNPINTDKYYLKRGLYPDRPRKIMYAGRLAQGKNLLLWLDIAKQILTEMPAIEFHLYGQGPMQGALELYVRDKGLEGKVLFHGYMKEIQRAYRDADLMLFLSEYESFGNVAVECVLSGTPLICSDIPSLREIFYSHPEFLVELGDRTKEQVLERIGKYDEMAASICALQDEFCKKFSMDRHIQSLREIYANIP